MRSSTVPYYLMAKLLPRIICTLAAVAFVAGFASPIEAKPAKKKQAKMMRYWAQAHMQLGEYHLKSGKFTEALQHFQALMALELPPPAENSAKQGERAERKKGKRGKKGKRKGKNNHKLAQFKLRAHLGAATAHFRLGEEEKSETIARKALGLAQTYKMPRFVKLCEKFLEGPQEVIDRTAPTAAELERRLKKLEKEFKP